MGGDAVKQIDENFVDVSDWPRPLYLLNVSYDGNEGKALLKLYDEVEGRIVFWYDKFGHKPYFLTDIPPDKVRGIVKIVNHPSFDHVETVEKYDLLIGKKRVMTKIVTKDPQAVATLRNYVPKAWEADIKYHDNYVFDLQLIPGTLYVIENGKLKPYKVELSSEVAKKIEELFKDEDEETRKMALEWIPLFEQPPPKVKRVAVDIEVYTPYRGRVPNPDEAPYPVISIAFAGNDGYKRVLVLYRPNIEFGELPKEYPNDAIVEIFDDERDLILEAFRIMCKYPVVLTFNGDEFDLKYLYNRALKLGIPKNLIPIKRTKTHLTFRKNIHIDLYKFFDNRSIQAYAFGGKYKEYTLDAIASALLGIAKIELEEDISALSIAKLVAYNFRDSWITLNLTLFDEELVWKLIILLMRISKLSIEDLTRSTISKWIKNLMYWEHRRRGYLIPLPDDIKVLKGKVKTAATIKGKKYAGAIVINPPTGVFFNITVLDFASLYPSIIKQWNLSYETVDPPEGYCPPDKIVKVLDENGNPIHEVCVARPGLTSQITGLLRDFRVKIYKKKAKDKSLKPEVRNWYDVVQRAMKVFINASYGVFGSEAFPLYAPPVAESVTAIGRFTIRNTISKAIELGLKVIYGDTDSLFVWNPNEEKLEELSKWVRENFGLELDIDKVYRYVAFSGLKKNYLGILPDGTVDVKGMVGKKRNTPEFIKKAFYDVLNALGKVNGPEDFEEVKNYVKDVVKQLYVKLKGKEYTLDELAFKVMLSKPLKEYKKTIPQHVRAALQLKALGYQISAGDIITYVKVKGKDGVKPVQLAKLSEIDVEKYLEHIRTTFEQILSALSIDWKEIAGVSKLEAFFKLH
ncbi:MAG: DNA-directed DNA polymerase I [Thermoprotei archaeon]|nr:MAG: DNA-directed DNA polymerase I [Thermoprotei archaeon]